MANFMKRNGVIQPNRLGWITDMSFTQMRDQIDITTMDGARQYLPGAGSIEVDLRIRAINAPALAEAMQQWFNDGISAPGPTYAPEWQCLYCGKPNNLEHQNCTKCGAPRSFVIG